MGIFDGSSDSPNHIKTEGQTISVTYKPGVPATGQATVAWNIPGAAQGCAASEDGLGAYCGIIVVLHDSPVQAAQAPVDGIFYTNDPTADSDKFAGDLIGGAKVVGAFYEGEKRAKGEALTTSLVVQDIEPNVNYFFAVYAVDCQGRYHTDGVRAYSSEYGNPDQPGTASTQVVQMNNGEGVQPTDGTNLTPGVVYEFDVEVNSNFPNAAGPNDIINVKVDGTNAQTYEELLAAINAQLALADNPAQSPVPPNTGSFYVDPTSAKLFEYNGTTYDPVDAMFELLDPVAGPGTYWFDPGNQTLQLRDVTDTSWGAIDLITYHEDPTTPQCDDYWVDGTGGWMFNGSVWCPVPFVSSVNDPAEAPGGTCGLFWFDTDDMALSSWDENTEKFVPRSAISYFEDPRNLTVGTYWFNDATNFLYIWDGSQFNIETNVVITSVTPQLNITGSGITAVNNDVGLLWYDPEHETLRIADNIMGPGGWFVDVTPGFIVWDEDPTTTEACDLWWDTTNDLLFNWDFVVSAWVQVASFVQQDTDPTLVVLPEVGTLWLNPTDDIVRYWDGNAWTEITTIRHATDPRTPATGVAWLNSVTGDISVYNDPAPGWNLIDPVDTDVDPAAIAPGAFWYNLTTNTLNTRVGASWVPVPFTSAPISHIKGELWFDTTTNTLMQWNGTAWVPAKPKLEIGLTADGNIAFQTAATGSCAAVMLIVPGSPQGQAGTGFADFHSYGHYYSYSEGAFTAPPQPTTNVPEMGFLFNNLPGQIYPQKYGEDGLKGTSMYDIVGVGTDGTPDERRELADSLRAQLGHPVVEVELTPYQIDTAITGALESLRKRSDIAYERGFYFLDVGHGHQIYKLTNKKAGFDRIVGIMGVHRFTSAFLSSAHGSGLYGQVVLQHLYNMGTYDLTSFHLVAQYIETMEDLFATRITYHWSETNRNLSLHQSFHRPERLLLDCYVERKEQDLLRDRWCKSWIEKYALSLCRINLAEIRGKFASLPGAGGGVSLNASDLAARADADIEELYSQLDDYVTSHVENFGMGTQFIIG